MRLVGQLLIAFVESAHLQMVNHHEVNMRTDYMTEQTMYGSFIIVKHGEGLFFPRADSSIGANICWSVCVWQTLNHLCLLNALSHQNRCS